jgi:hypothetical protein
MLKDMTRSKLIQIWFASVMLVIGIGVVFGASVTLGTAALLLGICLVPLGVILMLWPGMQPRTVAEVIHDAEQRQ